MSTTVRTTYEEFEAMIARGEFDSESSRRHELIDGEIVEMPPPGLPHEEATDRIHRWSSRSLPFDEVRVRVQGTIGLQELDSVPLPDVTWLRESDYTSRRPTAADVLLVIEVSDSSLSYDRNAKARLYAAAGIVEYWIANIPSRSIEVLRKPGPLGYASKQVFYSSDSIHPLAFPELAFPVSLIFPEP